MCITVCSGCVLSAHHTQDGALEDRVCDAVLALVVCHNVTPVVEEPTGNATDPEGMVDEEEEEMVVFRRDKLDDESHHRMTYQASSPDEVGVYVGVVKLFYMSLCG